MKKTWYKLLIFGLVLTMGVCYFDSATAGTSVATGADAQSGGSGASVAVDFQIVIPAFLVFRVGSPAGTDTIVFQPTVDEVRNATAGVAATSGGDAGNGVVTVEVISNGGGQITIDTNVSGGGAGLGTGPYIDWSQIVTQDSGGGGMAPPQLLNDGSGFADVPVSGGITDYASTWTYQYNNPATPPAPGTYDGTVTYVAAIP